MMAKLNKKNLSDFWMFKAPMELKMELDRIRIERIKKGKDLELQSYKRLGLAMARHRPLLDDLIKADLIKEDKDVFK
jgi:hypothetical protein